MKLPSATRVGALLVKELAELRRNRMALVPVVLLAVFSVGLPLLISLAVPMVAGEPLAADDEFLRAIRRSGVMFDTRQLSKEGTIQAFIFQQFLLMQVLIPVTGSMAFAGYSLIGEKQGRTLEPLLATPLTTAELLIAKGLGAILPSLGIMFVALGLYIVLIAGLAEPHVLRAVVNARALLIMFALAPVAALVALQLAVLVSSRVNDPRTAQQFGALLILPLTILFVAQLNGAFPLTEALVVMLTAALAVTWVLLVAVGVALFNREAILTRWK
jgi:ABC-2 type transport system permease protein